jgi:ribosomal-protein-alanine N-acetyltransferase
MSRNNFPEIQTERLLLRRLKQSDWKMISHLRSDKDVNQFVKRPSADSQEKALKFISKINSGIDNQNLYFWTITEKNQKGMIGSICLWNFSKDKKVAEVGYDLSRKFQGKGIMTESLKRIITFGFDRLKLETIEAFTHRLNVSSKKLLETNGFKIVLEKRDEHNPDNIVYAIKRVSS